MYISNIRSDHGGEFENDKFKSFCEKNGIHHHFSAPRTPQQNGVVERKNRTIQEMATTMLCESNLPKYFWAEAVNTACYIQNRILLHPILNKTPYELWKGRKSNISYFHPFGCKCTILNTNDSLDKFESKVFLGFLLGYSTSSKAYRVYNSSSKTVEESIHVRFNYDFYTEKRDDIDDEITESLDRNKDISNNMELIRKIEFPQKESIFKRDWKYKSSHPENLIIGETSGVRTRSKFKRESNAAFIYEIEPKRIDEALKDEAWILAMQEELNQFIRNQVWKLVPKPVGKTIIRTRWVFKNKLDKAGKVARNKPRLVAQGYNQQEGIDYNETYAPVTRLEAIRILLAYDVQHNIKLFQMDVKSEFLNSFIEEEIYVKQPPGFEDTEKSDYVYKLEKALYGLKQAPRAWYDRLCSFLIENNFTRGRVDRNLFRIC